MDEKLQAALSALRILMAATGVLVVAMGWADNDKVQTILRTLNEQIPLLAGALMVLVPFVWGPIKAYLATRKIKTAVNAGIALSNQSPTPTEPVKSVEEAKSVIEQFPPSTEKETKP